MRFNTQYSRANRQKVSRMCLKPFTFINLIQMDNSTFSSVELFISLKNHTTFRLQTTEGSPTYQSSTQYAISTRVYQDDFNFQVCIFFFDSQFLEVKVKSHHIKFWNQRFAIKHSRNFEEAQPYVGKISTWRKCSNWAQHISGVLLFERELSIP